MTKGTSPSQGEVPPTSLLGFVPAVVGDDDGDDDDGDKPITLSPPSSKSKSSQPFIEKCTSEILRIGSIIMFHLHE